LVFTVGAIQLSVAEDVGGDAMDTVTDCVALPPEPVQVSVYCVPLVRAAVLCDPLTATPPLHPPDATHAVAFVDVQVRVEVEPLCTVVGLAVKVTAGAGVVTVTVADCAALPPLPVQVSV
jgi:hypothetical protein